MLIYDVHAKHHFLIANHLKKNKFLQFDIKMPTWQPC